MAQYAIERFVGVNAAAAADTVYKIWPLETKGKLSSVYFVPDAAATLHATNYVTLDFNIGGTTVATFNTAATSLVAGTEQALTISGVGTAIEVSFGDQLAFDYAHAAAGVQTEGTWVAVFDLIR